MTTTTEPEEPGQILKTDKLGRVQVPVKRRDAILDEFERSGMSGTAFAGRYGIKYQTFASWRRKRRQAQEAGPEERPRFPLVEGEQSAAREPGPDDGLEIELAVGARLRIRSREQASLAADLLRALR